MNKFKSISGTIFLFLLGVLYFSRFSAFIVLEKLKSPVFFPELILIPFVPFLLKKYGRFSIRFFKRNVVRLFIMLFIFTFFILYSSLFNNYGFESILSASRGYFYISFFALVGYNLKTLNLKDIQWIALGSTVISFLWLFFNRENISSVYYVSLNCLFIATIIPLLRDKYYMLLLVVAMIVYIGVFSALRRVFAVLIIALFMGIVINLMQGKRKKNFILLTIIVLFIVFWDKLLGIILDLTGQNYYLYERIVAKSIESLFQSGARGDLNRVSNINNIPDHIRDYIFPHGFLTKNPSITGSGLYMDLPIYELFYTFGSLIVIPFLLFLIYKIVKKTIAFLSVPKIYFIIPIVNVLFISFLFFDGGFLIWQYNTIFTGLFFGLLFNKKVEIIYEHDKNFNSHPGTQPA